MSSLTETHDARATANVFIASALKKGRPFTPLQVIKLVYISHGWMLGLYQRPLFHQPVLAWLYGPVVRDVYRALRSYRADGVTKEVEIKKEQFDEYEEHLMDQVFDIYGLELSRVPRRGVPGGWSECPCFPRSLVAARLSEARRVW